MVVVVNGEDRELAERQTVADLLADLSLSKRACAVEVNKSLVPKARHAEVELKPGDRVEVVTLVGGG